MATVSSEVECKEAMRSNQRRNRRYNLSLPVNIRTISNSVVATSRDISTTGIYMNISNNIHLESELEFDLELPAELTNGNPGRIRCKATIVRVDRLNGSPTVGVAAEIHSYRFLLSK